MGTTLDSDITVRRKTAFLLNTLLLQDGPQPISTSAAPFPSDTNSHVVSNNSDSFYTGGQTSEALRSYRIVEELISSVVSPLPTGPDGDEDQGDADYQEKAVRTLLTYAELQKGAGLENLESGMKGLVDLGRAKSKVSGNAPWGLAQEEWQILQQLVKL